MSSKIREWAGEKYGETIVVSTINRIIDATKIENEKIMRMKLVQEKALERLNELAREDKNIEYINGATALVDYIMRHLIEANQFVINSTLTLSDFNTQLRLHPKEINGTNASGNLINELERYYDKSNNKILGLVRNFNKYKKKVTHQLFDEAIDPERINKEVRTYVQGQPITEIVKAAAEANTALVRDLVKKLQEYAVPKTNQPNLEDLEKKVRGY